MNEYFNFRCNNEYFKHSEFLIIWTLNAKKFKATINQINNYKQMFHMHMLCPLNINAIISYRSENDWVFDPSLVTHVGDGCWRHTLLIDDGDVVNEMYCWWVWDVINLKSSISLRHQHHWSSHNIWCHNLTLHIKRNGHDSPQIYNHYATIYACFLHEKSQNTFKNILL